MGVYVFSEIAHDLFEGTVLPVDLRLQAAIRPFHTPALDVMARALSDLPRPPSLYLLYAPFVAYALWTRRWATAVWIVLLPLATILLVDVLKITFHRARPLTAMVTEVGKSFPSSHATGAVVLYGVLGYVAWRYWVRRAWARAVVAAVVVFLMIGTGLARIYLEVHYPSDVLAGWAAGTALLAGGILLLRREGPRPPPPSHRDER